MAASDPQTLVNEGKCFTCFGGAAQDAIELALLVRVTTSITATGNFRITQTGDVRITQAGDNRVVN